MIKEKLFCEMCDFDNYDCCKRKDVNLILCDKCYEKIEIEYKIKMAIDEIFKDN